MQDVANKEVWVIGTGARGAAAAALLAQKGARVTCMDERDTPEVRSFAAAAGASGARTMAAMSALPSPAAELIVITPAAAIQPRLLKTVLSTGAPALSELEVGCQSVNCLSVVISGTNGKGTVAALVERFLAAGHRKTMIAGSQDQPVCAIMEASRSLDYLIVEAGAFQLETTECLRPPIAVLTNVAPDQSGRQVTEDDLVRVYARLLRHQQPFDWAVIQFEALARVRALGLPVPAKTITFSAFDPSADLHLDRGLLVSNLANWQGPLLDMDHCQLRGPHNAENLMAALAIGRILRLPLDAMLPAAKAFPPRPHRFELVAEIGGVQYINDSKATNTDALRKALVGARSARGGQPNVWLIAGGREQAGEFHDLGPVLSQRVKRAFLIGEATDKIRAAWSLFTPCTVSKTLLEAVFEAARHAVSGDVVLLSPACSSFDQFRNYADRGRSFCEVVKSISGGAREADPNMHGSETT